MLDFIKEHIQGLEDKESAKEGLAYFENTKKAIRFKVEIFVQKVNTKIKVLGRTHAYIAYFHCFF